MHLADLTRARDPHLAWAALRGDRPVDEIDGFIVVTGYEAAVEALHSADLASGAIADRYRNALPPGAAQDEMTNRINFLDAPDHGRVRRLVSKAFTPRRVEQLRPWIADTTDSLLADVDTSGTFDLLEVAHVLPSLVISELLGVPPEDRDHLTTWSDAVSPLLAMSVPAEDKARAVDAAEQFHAYLGALFDERRTHPTDDLLSALVQAEDDGDRLSMTELKSLAATLYSAGHRTTRDSLCNGLTELLVDDASAWRDFGAGRWTPAEVTEEVLRHQTPTLFVARVATVDTTLAGVPVVAGTPILVVLGAANRDPAVFDDPDRFVPGRVGPPPLSFAHGAHFCLGAALARAELQILLATLVDRLPDIRLVDPHIDWHVRGPFRGVDRLHVAVGMS